MNVAKFLSENEFYAQEDRAIKVFIGIFLVIHIAAICLSGYNWFSRNKPIIEEWEMEADLYVGGELLTPDKTTLPKAELAKELAVPETMLPQLPKNVSIKTTSEEQPESDDGDVRPDSDKNAKPAEEKKKEDDLLLQKNADNKINKEDFLRRAALEKLREEEKFAKNYQAEQDDAIARLKSQSKIKTPAPANLGGITGSQLKVFEVRVQAHIRRCYLLPEAYNLKNANMSVRLAVNLGPGGEVNTVTIQDSSGDKVFDDIALKAVKDCAPMPAPPKTVAGKTWAFNFKP